MKESFAFNDKDQISCKWCGEPTRYLGTGECNGCWELRTRMEHDLGFASRMLESLQEGVEVEEVTPTKKEEK